MSWGVEAVGQVDQIGRSGFPEEPGVEVSLDGRKAEAARHVDVLGLLAGFERDPGPEGPDVEAGLDRELPDRDVHHAVLGVSVFSPVVVGDDAPHGRREEGAEVSLHRRHADDGRPLAPVGEHIGPDVVVDGLPDRRPSWAIRQLWRKAFHQVFEHGCGRICGEKEAGSHRPERKHPEQVVVLMGEDHEGLPVGEGLDDLLLAIRCAERGRGVRCDRRLGRQEEQSEDRSVRSKPRHSRPGSRATLAPPHTLAPLVVRNGWN